MNRLRTLFLLLLIMSCTPDHQQADKLVETVKIVDSIIVDEPYDLKIEIEKMENNDYILETSMVLDNGSAFVSPNSKGDFKGKFSIAIKKNDKLILDDNLIETPLSVEEYNSHPFVGGYANWVKVSTTYRQQLHLISQEDFEVSGFVRFVIEPRCTREQIGFTILHHSGEMKVQSFKINNGCPTTPFDRDF